MPTQLQSPQYAPVPNGLKASYSVDFSVDTVYDLYLLSTYQGSPVIPVSLYIDNLNSDQDITVTMGGMSQKVPAYSSGSLQINGASSAQFQCDSSSTAQAAIDVLNYAIVYGTSSPGRGISPSLNNYPVNAPTYSVLGSSKGAGYIGLKTPLTGAALRNVQDKLNYMLDVRDFGAVGDGKNDDSNAFIAAIKACFPTTATCTVNGNNYFVATRSLFIPPGVYRVTKTINANMGFNANNIGVGLNIFSPRSTPMYSGGSSALLAMPAVIVADTNAGWINNQSIVDLQYCQNTTFDNIAVMGIYGTTKGLDISNGSMWSLDSAAFFQHKYGLFANQSGQLHLRNAGASNCQYVGIYMLNSGDSDLDGCYLNTNNQNYATDANQGIGLYLGTSNNTNVRGGKNEYNSIGIYLNDTQGINISGINFDTNAQLHIYGNYDSTAGTNPNSLELKSININGNRFLGGGFAAGTLPKSHIAIYTGQSDSDIVITGNSFRKGSSLAYDENTGGSTSVGPGTYCIYGDHQGDKTYSNNWTIDGNDFNNGSVTNRFGFNAPNGAIVNVTGQNSSNLPDYINGNGVMVGGPSFHAYTNTTTNNVTGNGTVYTPIYDTVEYNYGGCYNPATGIFTAPIAGLYYFSASVGISNSAAACYTYGDVAIKTPAYASDNIGIGGFAKQDTQIYGSCQVKMNAGDTAQITIKASGGTLAGNVGPYLTQMYFTGHLVR